MNYPPANVWRKLEPEIEQRIEPEPELVEVTTRAWRCRLLLPTAWSLERRDANLEAWMKR